jgi:hypothetical protein
MSPEEAKARLCVGELVPLSHVFASGLGLTAASLRDAGREDLARGLERIAELHRLHHHQLKLLVDRLLAEAP